MSGETILIVEDEENIVELIKTVLEKEGYKIYTAYNGREALERINYAQPDLIVLDLMLPEIDGWEVCRRVRKEKDIPIIMLTAREEDTDKIVGLEIGADDYMTKPFNPRELVARIKAILRRFEAAKGGPEKDRLVFKNLEIDSKTREVLIKGKKATLRAKEFDLLAKLAKNPNVVFTRDGLLESVWGYEYIGDTRTVDAHISRLRDIFKKCGVKEEMIETIWSIGYKFTGEK